MSLATLHFIQTLQVKSSNLSALFFYLTPDQQKMFPYFEWVMQLFLLTQVSKWNGVYFYENVDVDLCHLLYNVNVKHDVLNNEKWSEHIQL